MELELCLEPDDAARLTRLPMLAPLKAGKARSRVLRILWHDSPGRDLAAAGLALVEQGPQWRLERLRPDHESWLPGAVAPVLAAGRDAADIDHPRPEQVLTVAQNQHSRDCLLLLEAILETPGLLPRLTEVLRPKLQPRESETEARPDGAHKPDGRRHGARQ